MLQKLSETYDVVANLEMASGIDWYVASAVIKRKTAIHREESDIQEGKRNGTCHGNDHIL